MAKINARGTHQLGPTLFTERVRPASYDGDVDTVYYEAWRLRSDGVVQTRIIRTRPVEGQEGHVTEHRGSAFRNFGTFSSVGPATPHHEARETLANWLARRGMTIVKEQHR